MKEMNSLDLAHLYQDHIWIPNMVISNHGPQFVSRFMKELNKILGIDTKLSTAYHPQTDGQTERIRVKHRCRSTCSMQLTGLTGTGTVAEMPYLWDTIPVSAVSRVLMVSLSYPDMDVAG